MKKNKLTDLLFLVGNVLLFAGALAGILKYAYAYFLFGAGSAVLLILYLMNMSALRDAGVRERRLARNGVFASFVLCIGVYFMYTGSNSWIVALLIYALTTLFLTFRQVKK